MPRRALLSLFAALALALPAPMAWAGETSLEAHVQASTGIARAVDATLRGIAAKRAVEIQTKGAFSHRYLGELNNGSWSSWGEVLGWNRGYADPAGQMVIAWLESTQGHREVLLNRDYTRIGCGMAFLEVEIEGETGSSGWYGACILAVPAETGPEPAPAPISPVPPRIEPDLPTTLPDTAMTPLPR